jgi:EmrB/QacA subfamily drug resistance transporter
VFPAEERAKAIGAWAGVAGLGGALGPLTGGFLVEHFYWGSVFLVNVPIVIVGLIAGVILIPTSKDPSAPRLDPLGALLSIVGLTALLYAIIEAPSDGWGATNIVMGFIIGAVLLAGFVLWELHTDHPMLDVHFFQNPRFTAASGSITLTFFAMFGSIFLLTQYLQFTLGYTPLETGIRMLPFAGAMMITAPTSARIAERIGTKITVATGMLIITLVLLSMTLLQVDTGYLTIGVRLFFMGIGMGLVMAPATDSVMGSLPLAKAGVGSAVNDTTRQVGGAMGVAIIGSVLASTYGIKISDFLAGTPAPAAAVTAAKGSIGGAFGVAAELPQQLSSSLISTANHAFVEAIHRGVVVAAIATAAGALVAWFYLPARARQHDVHEQDEEYQAEWGAAVEPRADTMPVQQP